MENKNVFPTGLGQQKHVAHTYHRPCHGGFFFRTNALLKARTRGRPTPFLLISAAQCATVRKGSTPHVRAGSAKRLHLAMIEC